jgi:cytidylate kinase
MFKRPAPRDAQKLVEDQVHKWAQSEKKRAGEETPEPWPLITVSREFGALGTVTGEQAARRLGFSFWDQEIVHAIAEQTGIQETLLASLDEQTRTRIEDFIGESVFGAGTTAVKYVRQVIRVVRTIERHGGAVVIGRGAQFILAREAALRVRVVCPYEQRVAGYAKREGLSEREAESRLVRVERERQGEPPAGPGGGRARGCVQIQVRSPAQGRQLSGSVGDGRDEGQGIESPGALRVLRCPSICVHTRSLR